MGRAREEWQEVDRLIWAARNKIRFLDRITPKNAAEERNNFLRHWKDGTFYLPSFDYDADHFSPDPVANTLEQCEDALADVTALAHEDDILTFYEKTLDTLWSEYAILTNLGDSDVAQDESATIYGQPPTKKEVQTAENVLTTVRERYEAGEKRSSDMYEACQNLLQTLQLKDWGVTYTDGPYPSAAAAEKVLKVPNPLQKRTYTLGEPSAVAAHEVSHGIRAANGYTQPYSIFATGISGYHATDEGLSILLEFAYGNKHTGVMMQSLRTHALRVLAADAARNDETFWDAFNLLMDYTTNEDKAWHVTLRAYRGGDGDRGGVIKDHIYQRGLTQVTRQLRRSSNPEKALRTLYVGKFGVDDFSAIHELLEYDVLKTPTYTPFPLLNQEDILDMAERIASRDIGAVLQPA